MRIGLLGLAVYFASAGCVSEVSGDGLRSPDVEASDAEDMDPPDDGADPGVPALQEFTLSAPYQGKQLGPVPGAQTAVSTRNGLYLGVMSQITDPKRPNYGYAEILVSRDQGESFQTLKKTELMETAIPYLVAAGDKLSVVVPKFDFVTSSHRSLLWSFSGPDDSEFSEFLLPDSGNKGALDWDPVRQLLYFAPRSFNVAFMSVDPSDGSVVSPLVRTFSPVAPTEFERSLVATSGNDLFYGWTTYYGTRCEPACVWDSSDIRFMRSTDGGVSWSKLDGTPVSLPVTTAEANSQTDSLVPVSERGEFGNQKFGYFAKMLGTSQHVYFFYTYSSPTQTQQGRFVRYDSTKKTFDLKIDDLHGDSIHVAKIMSDFAEVRHGDSFILLAATINGTRVRVIASDDHGETWRDYAVSDEFPVDWQPQFLQLVRNPLSDGTVMGAIDLYLKTDRFERAFITFKIQLPPDQ